VHQHHSDAGAIVMEDGAVRMHAAGKAQVCEICFGKADSEFPHYKFCAKYGGRESPTYGASEDEAIYMVRRAGAHAQLQAGAGGRGLPQIAPGEPE